MLKSIHIKNFKTHRDLLIDFSEGLNCILARSNRGKSAIISACNWLITNKPSGLSFRNWECKEGEIVTVSWKFNNGDFITREKNELSEQNGGIDRYILYVDGKKKVFDRPNKGVPEEVSSYLNLNYYNTKTQFAPFFLLQESPGDVGRKFNDIVGLDIIDSVVKNAKGYVSETKSEYEKAAKEVKRLESEIEELNYVAGLKAEVIKLESDYENYVNRYKDFEAVVDIVDNHIYKILEETKEDEKIISFESEIDKLIENAVLYNERKNNLELVRDLIDEIYELQSVIDECEKIVSFSSEIDELIKLEENRWARKAILSEVDDLIDEIGEAEEEIEEYEKLIQFESEIDELIELNGKLLDREDRYEDVISLYDSIIDVKADIGVAEEELEEYKYKYEEIIKQGGVCPTCKAVLTEDQLRNIEL